MVAMMATAQHENQKQVALPTFINPILQQQFQQPGKLRVKLYYIFGIGGIDKGKYI